MRDKEKVVRCTLKCPNDQLINWSILNYELYIDDER